MSDLQKVISRPKIILWHTPPTDRNSVQNFITVKSLNQKGRDRLARPIFIYFHCILQKVEDPGKNQQVLLVGFALRKSKFNPKSNPLKVTVRVCLDHNSIFFFDISCYLVLLFNGIFCWLVCLVQDAN